MALRRNALVPSIVALLAGIVLLAGCASRGPAAVLPVWPPAPAPARIALLRTVRSAADLVSPGFFDRVGDLLLGARKRLIRRPQGVAVQGDERLYVIDQELQGVHVLDLRSREDSFIDRAGDTYFVSPVGVAVCEGKVAVSDSALKAVFLLSPDGALERVIEKPGGFKRPTGLAYAPRQKLLYVVDTLAHEVCAFDLSGRLVRRIGSPGTGTGQFNYPTHVFVDGSGKLYVTDSLNFRVQIFDPSGQFVAQIGALGDASGYLAVPKGVGVDSFGHIYVVDSYFCNVQVFEQDGRFLLAFGGEGRGAGDFQVPTGLTVDSRDRIFVSDSYNNRVQIFQYLGTNDEQALSDR